MKYVISLIAAALVAGAATAAEPAVPETVDVDVRTDSVSTAIATVMGPLVHRNLVTLRGLGLNIDTPTFVRALGAYLSGEPTGFTPESADAYIDAQVRSMHPEMQVDTVSVASQQQFLDDAAKQPGAITLPSGVVFIVLQEGEGAMPSDTDKVQVSYQGKLSNGTVFDSTVEDGPATFDVTGVVPGFSDGLRNMRPGGTYRMVIPADKAYGARGIPGIIPGNSALDFTVTLLKVNP